MRSKGDGNDTRRASVAPRLETSLGFNAATTRSLDVSIVRPSYSLESISSEFEEDSEKKDARGETSNVTIGTNRAIGGIKWMTLSRSYHRTRRILRFYEKDSSFSLFFIEKCKRISLSLSLPL